MPMPMERGSEPSPTIWATNAQRIPRCTHSVMVGHWPCAWPPRGSCSSEHKPNVNHDHQQCLLMIALRFPASPPS
jgi:hypothetical protein